MADEQPSRRTLILTGASRGIGHATVQRFSEEGWSPSDGVCGVSPTAYRARAGQLSFHKAWVDEWVHFGLKFTTPEVMIVTISERCRIELRRGSELSSSPLGR